MMSKFKDFLINGYHEAYLIEEREGKTKEEYISGAEEGIIVAFRLNFTARSGKKLTKVISGKILENVSEQEAYVVETKNGLKYGVPYDSVVWVKTGNRFPKGVYDEMKRGSVEVEEGQLGQLEFSELVDIEREKFKNGETDFDLDI